MKGLKTSSSVVGEILFFLLPFSASMPPYNTSLFLSRDFEKTWKMHLENCPKISPKRDDDAKDSDMALTNILLHSHTQFC